MLDKLKDATSHRIMLDYPADRATPLTEVETSDIPSDIRHFLVRTAERRIALSLSEAISRADAWIEPSDVLDDLDMDVLVSAARRTAEFPAGEWKPAVLRAVDLVISHSVAPVDTLLKFAFGSERGSASVVGLQRRASYFSHHGVIGRALELYLERKPADHVNREDLEETLRHIHRQIIAEYDIDQWLAALKPLVEMTHYAGFGEEGVPIPGAVAFFSAHGRQRLGERILSEARTHGASFIRIETLRGLFDETGADQASQISPADHLSRHSTDKVSSEAAPESDDSVPLWKRFRKSGEHDGPVADQSEADPIWKRFHEDSPTTASAVSPDEQRPPAHRTVEPSSAAGPDGTTRKAGGLEELEDLILTEHKKSRGRFVRVLFKGDRTAYADTLSRLADIPDWPNASRMLAQDVFKRYGVDIYNDTAVEFTDAVEAYFEQK